MNGPRDPNRPTLAELRARAYKPGSRAIGNWLARFVARPSAIYGTWIAIRVGISADQVTAAALLSTIAAAISIGSGTSEGFAVGVLLGHLAFWLDHVDGQVARYRETSNLDGVYFDYMMHHTWSLCMGFALGHSLASRLGSSVWSIAGFSLAASWTLLGLHNDCRYKAFFERLKGSRETYVIVGGSGGRPSRAPGPPKSPFGLLRWVAYKACEPHIVLIGLTAIAAIGLFSSDIEERALVFGVSGASIVAPILALGRIARTIGSRSVEREFASWFRSTREFDRGPD